MVESLFYSKSAEPTLFIKNITLSALRLSFRFGEAGFRFKGFGKALAKRAA